MSDKEKKEPTTREIMDKVYAMTPEEFNRMMHENFRRMCNKPLPGDGDQ